MKKENQHLIRYSMQLAMLHQLLYKKLITQEEYFLIKKKLMKDYNVISDLMTRLLIYSVILYKYTIL